ncbi:hypothetical protein HanIR_Chr05g0240701 [Helianthus annuus]|nr:hypothetical protein HanIR_Chr05g0240701 [Helianthus annuus]
MEMLKVSENVCMESGLMNFPVRDCYINGNAVSVTITKRNYEELKKSKGKMVFNSEKSGRVVTVRVRFGGNFDN